VQLAQQVPVFLGTGESCADAVAALDSAGVDRALVLRDGRLAGTVGRDDLLTVIAQRRDIRAETRGRHRGLSDP